MESTLVIIKPNGVSSGLIGRIIERYESARLSVQGIRVKTPTQMDVEGFYAEHVSKPFFGELAEYMTSGPVVLMVLGGDDAIAKVRTLNGATDPAKAEAGTIRHAFAPNITRNVVHSSDSETSALREISFWFNVDELVNYEPSDQRAS